MADDLANPLPPSAPISAASTRPSADPAGRALAGGVVGFAAGVVLQGLLHGRLPDSPGWRLALALVPLHMAALAGTAGALLRGAPPRRWLARCGFGALSRRAIGQALGGTVVAFAAVALVQAASARAALWLGLNADPQGAVALITALDSPAARTAAALVVVLWVPLAEEVLFRRVLTDAIAQAGRRYAGVWSAAAFAAVHGSLVQAPALLVLALILQRLRRPPGGLWAPVLAHGAFNALSLLGWRLV
ncbi:MAG: CPBP family intramembrane metalloprotease [Lentisphaerae bacterium]|nr:CPBP family intramembrane metalloprotease [Lentisphaerota bacterium]